MKNEIIGEWMTPNPITITPDTTLPEAHRIMKERNIRRLPVMENDRLVGIVTLGDVRGAEPSGATSLSIWEINYLVSRLRIAEIMTPDPVVINADSPVSRAAHLMLKYRVSGLPVVDYDGHLIGIITESDIFRMVARDWQLEAAPV